MSFLQSSCCCSSPGCSSQGAGEALRAGVSTEFFLQCIWPETALSRPGKVSAVGLLLGVSFSQLRADLGQFRAWAESGSAVCVPEFHLWSFNKVRALGQSRDAGIQAMCLLKIYRLSSSAGFLSLVAPEVFFGHVKSETCSQTAACGCLCWL